MDIRISRTPSLIRVELSGRLCASTSGAVFDALTTVATKPSVRLLLDLDSVHEVTRAGLRPILVAAKLLEHHAGRMAIRSSSRALGKMLADSGFAHLFTVHADRACSEAALDTDRVDRSQISR